MKRMKVHCISLGAFMLVGGLTAPGPAEAQDAKQPYASMAPVDEYLMARDAEVALTRSAAPDAISRDATVLALGRLGYKTAMKRKNAFSVHGGAFLDRSD